MNDFLNSYSVDRRIEIINAFGDDISNLYRKWRKDEITLHDIEKDLRSNKILRYITSYKTEILSIDLAIFHIADPKDKLDFEKFKSYFYIKNMKFAYPIPKCTPASTDYINQKPLIFRTKSPKHYGKIYVTDRYFQEETGIVYNNYHIKFDEPHETLATCELISDSDSIYRILETSFTDPYLEFTFKEAWNQIEIMNDGKWYPGYQMYLYEFTNQ